MDKKIIEILKSSPIFCKASEENISSALSGSACFIAEYELGENVAPPKGFGKCVGFIFGGKAKVYSSDGDRNVLLRSMSAGDIFGVASLFGDGGEISTIVAGRGCKVMFIEAISVLHLLEADKDFMHEYLLFLSDRIRFLNRKITFYTSGSAERRLAYYLSSFNASEIEPDIPMNSLCELLDIGRASLYRAFDKLTDDGFIKRDGDTIIIVDRQAMLDFYKISK